MKRLVATLFAILPIGAAGAADPACELRVWPAQATHAVNAGILSNFGFVGAYADLHANRDKTLRDQVLLIETLTLPVQAQAMAAMDLPRLLDIIDAKLIFETRPIDVRAAPRQRLRMSASTAPCYAELIVRMNEYRDSAVRGASLKTEFTFKDFRTGAPKITTGSEASALTHFPARTPDQDALARRDVSDAFTKNLDGFVRRIAEKSRLKR